MRKREINRIENKFESAADELRKLDRVVERPIREVYHKLHRINYLKRDFGIKNYKGPSPIILVRVAPHYDLEFHGDFQYTKDLTDFYYSKFQPSGRKLFLMDVGILYDFGVMPIEDIVRNRDEAVGNDRLRVVLPHSWIIHPSSHGIESTKKHLFYNLEDVKSKIGKIYSFALEVEEIAQSDEFKEYKRECSKLDKRKGILEREQEKLAEIQDTLTHEFVKSLDKK